MPDETILVVDDSPTILKLVQLALAKAGYRVVTAASGAAGLEAAREDRPRLLLLDFLLPDMTGEDVCRAMSAEAALAEVPVLVMSARGEELAERLDRMPGVVDHITKPFSPDALLAVVAHTLEKQARPGPDEAPGATESAAIPIDLELEQIAPAHPAPRDTGEIRLESVALSGDLAVISIADVLHLLQDQAQTGTLTLAHEFASGAGGLRSPAPIAGGHGNPERVPMSVARLDVFLRAGRIDFATARGVPEEFLLGRFLVGSGEVPPAALAAVIEERKRDGAATGLLGADLIARGLLQPAGLRKAMSTQTAALVYEGLRWGSGRFWFHATADLPPVAREAALQLPADGLIMTGLRRIDEWRLIEREIGDFDLVFVRNDERIGAFGRANLLREEMAVLEFVNGKHSVRDIVYLTHMGSFDVTKMLYRLLRNKLIRRRVAPVAV